MIDNQFDLLNDIYYNDEYISLYVKQGEELFNFKYVENNNILANKSIKRPIKKIGRIKVSDGFFDPATLTIEDNLAFVATPIPGELWKHVKTVKSPHQPPDCSKQSPVHNFVYLKTHKAASDTLSAMFRRFSYTRNLSAVLTLGAKYNFGWPWDLRQEFHRPSKTGNFNVLFDHCKFTESYMKKIMPPGTVYIGSLRETFSHLKSAMARLEKVIFVAFVF